MLGISVIVPVYNVENLVGRCLESLVNQTFNSYEIIVINDGTKDSSMDVVSKIAQKHPDLIKVFEQENSGLSVTRNNGIDLSVGKYIYFIDSDDYIKPETLEMMYNFAEKFQCDYVIDGFNNVDEAGNFLEKHSTNVMTFNQPFNPIDSAEFFLVHNSVWNRLYLKSTLNENKIRFIPGLWYEDLIFTRQYLIHSKKAIVLDQQFYQYVQREGSLMSSLGSDKNIDIIEIFSLLIEYYKSNDYYEVFNQEIEILALDHLYLAAVVRVSRASRFDLAMVLADEFRNRFPNYKKNKYYTKKPLKHKFLLSLIDLNAFKVIKQIFR